MGKHSNTDVRDALVYCSSNSSMDDVKLSEGALDVLLFSVSSLSKTFS
jgi:hypothetical protein